MSGIDIWLPGCLCVFIHRILIYQPVYMQVCDWLCDRDVGRLGRGCRRLREELQDERLWMRSDTQTDR